VTTVARLLRGLLPILAASATVAAAGLPAAAAELSPAAQPGRSGQWWLSALHVPAALHGSSAAGRGVTVAVLSTGVDASHPDLAGSVTAGPDFSQTGRKPGGPYWGGEGTAVASLIAGHGHGAGGAQGITGVAPGARILSVQVTLEYDDPLNSDSAITRRLPAAIAAGIRYAVGHGATIIALPLDPGTLGRAGDPAAAGGSAAERAAVSFALAHDVLLVAPAGDNRAETNTVSYPAAYRGVIAVGATAQNGQLAPFTGAHSYVALTAPGSGDTPAVPLFGGTSADPAAGLTVAAPDDGYQSLASTDMSAALTAGVAALIRSRYPRLTVAEVTQAVERGATEPNGTGSASPASGRGRGGLNAASALTAAAAVAAAHPAPAVSPATPTGTPAVTGPARTVPAPNATPDSPDPGHLLRSLVTGLAIAAGVLIACLIGAITLTRLRRRRRASPAIGPAGPARPNGGASPARHARGQSATAPPPLAPPPTAPRAVSWFTDPAPRPPANQRQAARSPAGRAHAQAQEEQPPDVIWLSEAPQRQAPSAQQTDGQQPDVWPVGRADRRQPDGQAPWPPASPPGNRVTPESFLPAEPDVQPEGRLAPWEKSPADFAAAPPPDDRAPWPVSTTGPMYVWNPAATTGPLGIVADEAEDDAGE
jgi:subtilisin family serine protease